MPGWTSIAIAQSRTANGSAQTDPILAFVPRVGRGLIEDVLTESHRSFPIPADWNLLSQKTKIRRFKRESRAQCTAYSECGLCGSLLQISAVGSYPRAEPEPTEHTSNRADHIEKWRSVRSDLKVTTVFYMLCVSFCGFCMISYTPVDLRGVVRNEISHCVSAVIDDDVRRGIDLRRRQRIRRVNLNGQQEDLEFAVAKFAGLCECHAVEGVAEGPAVELQRRSSAIVLHPYFIVLRKRGNTECWENTTDKHQGTNKRLQWHCPGTTHKNVFAQSTSAFFSSNDRVVKKLAISVEKPGAMQLWASSPRRSSAKHTTMSPRSGLHDGMFCRNACRKVVRQTETWNPSTSTFIPTFVSTTSGGTSMCLACMHART